MRILHYKRRLFFSALIIAAFFIPAYQNVSAFSFISLAWNEVKPDSDVTRTDLVVVLLPLLIIPLIALVIMLRSMASRSTAIFYRSIPFLCLIFFFLVLSVGSNRQDEFFDSSSFFKQMGIGFYMAVLASVLLIFTENKSQRGNTIKFTNEGDN